MKKFFETLFIVFFLLLYSSCAGKSSKSATVVTKVNTYRDQGQQIHPLKQIYVHHNDQVTNQLLEKEVRQKLELILNYKGYRLTRNINEADYILIHGYALSSGGQQIYSSFSYKYNVFKDSFDIVPETGSIDQFVKVLILHLYEKSSLLSTKKIPIWISESNSVGTSSDLRIILEYLMISSLKYFGEDTNGQKVVKISSDDDVKEILDNNQ